MHALGRRLRGSRLGFLGRRSDRLPVGYPGLLQDLEQVYVVSTTAETTRRMERDGYPETAQSETARTETTQNQEVN